MALALAGWVSSWVFHFFRSKYIGSCQGTLASSSSPSDPWLAAIDGIWWGSITKNRLQHYMLHTLQESSLFETNYTIYSWVIVLVTRPSPIEELTGWEGWRVYLFQFFYCLATLYWIESRINHCPRVIICRRMKTRKMIVFISPNLDEKYPDICDSAGQIWNTWMNPLQISGCGLFTKWYVNDENRQKWRTHGSVHNLKPRPWWSKLVWQAKVYCSGLKNLSMDLVWTGKKDIEIISCQTFTFSSVLQYL